MSKQGLNLDRRTFLKITGMAGGAASLQLLPLRGASPLLSAPHAKAKRIQMKLITQIRHGNWEGAWHSLGQGARINAVGPSPMGLTTPINAAITAGHEAIVYRLLHMGASMDQVHPLVPPPLYVAAGRGQWAVGMGQGSIVGILLNEKKTVAFRDEDGKDALLHAASKGHFDYVKDMLRKGWPAQTSDRHGQNVWHHYVQILTENHPPHLYDGESPDINAVDHQGRTPLMLAIIAGRRIQYLDNLVSWGANPQQHTLAGSALAIAKQCGREDAVGWLHGMGASSVT